MKFAGGFLLHKTVQHRTDQKLPQQTRYRESHQQQIEPAQGEPEYRRRQRNVPARRRQNGPQGLPQPQLQRQEDRLSGQSLPFRQKAPEIGQGQQDRQKYRGAEHERQVKKRVSGSEAEIKPCSVSCARQREAGQKKGRPGSPPLLPENRPEPGPAAEAPLSDQQPGKPVQGKVCRRDGYHRQTGQQEDQVELQQRGGLLAGDPKEKADAACRRGLLPGAALVFL